MASYLSNRSASWHDAAKIESENPGYNSIFENADCENSFEVENIGCKNPIILNHDDSNHINTNLNHSNYVESKLTDFNQLIPAYSTTINYSADVRALNQLLSLYGDSADAAASTVSTRTTLA